jgi:hypothetical protein
MSASAEPKMNNKQKSCVVGSARTAISTRFLDWRLGWWEYGRSHTGNLTAIQVHMMENRPIEAPTEH